MPWTASPIWRWRSWPSKVDKGRDRHVPGAGRPRKPGSARSAPPAHPALRALPWRCRRALFPAVLFPAALFATAMAAVAEPRLRFEPIALPAHEYVGGWEHFVGGGIAAFDCDDDGRPELYAAGGAAPAVLLRNVPGDALAFAAATPPALALTGVTGAYPLDVDGDGRLDLAVLRVGPDALLRGGQDCAFAPFEGLELPERDAWTTAFSATWEGEAALPTLAFGAYVDRGDPEGPFEACDANWLLRPVGRAYAPPLLLEPGFCALSMLFTDWNRAGRADLRVSNDRHYYVRGGQEQLWAMEPAPRLYGPQEGWRAHALWGMGIASRDIDGDGRTDVFLTSMGDQRLQLRGPGAGPDYVDAPFAMGTSAHRPHVGDDGRPSTGWHVAFGDVDLDGRDDVFIAKGNVDQMPGNAMADPNSLLWQRADGTFEEVSGAAGVADPARSRGAVLADLDGDGRLDLAVANRRAPLRVWRNVTGPAGGWLAVALRQPGPNARAVGAWIELRLPDGRIVVREVTVGGGHAGGSALPEHFGLGDAAAVDLRVVWPDAATSGWVRVEAGRVLTVRRGDAGALTLD